MKTIIITVHFSMDFIRLIQIYSMLQAFEPAVAYSMNYHSLSSIVYSRSLIFLEWCFHFRVVRRLIGARNTTQTGGLVRSLSGISALLHQILDMIGTFSEEEIILVNNKVQVSKRIKISRWNFEKFKTDKIILTNEKALKRFHGACLISSWRSSIWLV